MIKVEFLGPMSEIEPKELKASEVATLGDLKAVLQADSRLHKWLPISAVAVNDELIDDVGFTLKSGDKIALLPPVCGG